MTMIRAISRLMKETQVTQWNETDIQNGKQKKTSMVILKQEPFQMKVH